MISSLSNFDSANEDRINLNLLCEIQCQRLETKSMIFHCIDTVEHVKLLGFACWVKFSALELRY